MIAGRRPRALPDLARISPDRLRRSYGKEFPFDPGHTEEAYAKNRRAHFVVTSQVRTRPMGTLTHALVIGALARLPLPRPSTGAAARGERARRAPPPPTASTSS